MVACKLCGIELTGRRRSFCSTAHGNEYWKRARIAGMEVKGFTDPVPEINAFLQDFRKLLEKHQDGVNALAAKRKF